MQIPPMYSALKVGGKKLYELAREGKVIEREPRPVYFHEIKILGIELPCVRLSVTCSKGTYIRTLCHDIGEKLGCGGCMEALLRTRSGRFTLEESYTLAQIEEAVRDGSISEKILSIEKVLEEYPRICVLETGDKLLANGNPLTKELLCRQEEYGWVRMCTSQGVFAGIYQWDMQRERYYPVKMF